MKATVPILLGAAMILVGCVVTSVCPYYTQKDLVFERGLLGSWENSKKAAEFWCFETNDVAKGGDLSYEFTLYEPSKTTVMEAHAFKLSGQLFLDIFSLEKDFHVIPAHYVLKVSQLEPYLRLSELNDDWLKDLLAKNPAALHHQFVETGDEPGDQRIVLTGDTPELQEFLVMHLKTKGAWKDSFELHRDYASNGHPSHKRGHASVAQDSP